MCEDVYAHARAVSCHPCVRRSRGPPCNTSVPSARSGCGPGVWHRRTAPGQCRRRPRGWPACWERRAEANVSRERHGTAAARGGSAAAAAVAALKLKPIAISSACRVGCAQRGLVVHGLLCERRDILGLAACRAHCLLFAVWKMTLVQGLPEALRWGRRGLHPVGWAPALPPLRSAALRWSPTLLAGAPAGQSAALHAMAHQ